MKSTDWYWFPYIPVGKLTILGGDPGQGKSFITTALAAAASKGDPLPGQGEGTGEITRTLMFTAEDALDDTVVPRLVSMQADLTQIDLFDRPFSLDDAGIAGMKRMIQQGGYTLVVIDPIVAYLGAKMDMNRANEVRPILRALYDLAAELNIALVMVRHMRKMPAGTKGGKAIYNGMGSIDFTAAARSELQVDEGSNGQMYLNHIKANSGGKGKSVEYRIENDTFTWGPQVDQVVFKKNTKAVSKKFKGETVVRLFLFDLLKDHPDGLPSNDVFLAAKAQGISDTKLKAVKVGMVLSTKEKDHWQWRLDPKAARVVNDPDDVLE